MYGPMKDFLRDPLWSAKCLIEPPDIIRGVRFDYYVEGNEFDRFAWPLGDREPRGNLPFVALRLLTMPGELYTHRSSLPRSSGAGRR
jgi:hypothetical protein